MSSNLQNSIWPNTDGNLGNIKIQIPDGVTTPWPTGDALVNYFVFNKGKLVGFVDIKALIANTSKTTTFPYDYVNISLPSIAEGEMTYNYDQCTYVVLNGKVLKGDVPSDEELEIITKKYLGCKTLADIIAVDPNYLTNDIINGVWKEGLADLEQGSYENGNGMFSNCSALTSFTSDLPKLTNGCEMFNGCSSLKSFDSDLSSLTNGVRMFYYSAIESFNSDLSSLIVGNFMFCGCLSLKTFDSDLSSLTHGTNMFNYCSALTSFTSDLSKLTDGDWMFNGCSKLTTFDSDLSKLTCGLCMFENCKLDTASVQKIASTINDLSDDTDDGDYGWGQIHIGIGNTTPNTEEETAFNTIASKGWQVFVNGSQYTPTSPAAITTLDETGQETVTPIPYYAKPIQVTDEDAAEYVDANNNYYNILGAQFIYGDNLETYGMFTCQEDAATQMSLTKIEK